MKKLLKSILFIGIFIVFGLGAQSVFADETKCRVDDQIYLGGIYNNKNFSQLPDQIKSQLLNQLFSGQDLILIESEFSDQITCTEKTIPFKIIGLEGEEVSNYIFPSDITEESLVTKEILINASKLCDPNTTTEGNNCSVKFEIQGENLTANSETYNSGENLGRGVFHFKCEGDQCTQDIKFKINKPKMQISNLVQENKTLICINSLKNNNYTFSKVLGNIINRLRVSLNTTDCIGIPLEVRFYGLKDALVGGYAINDADVQIETSKGTKEILKFIPNKNEVTIDLKTNGDSCYAVFNNPDCLIYIEISNEKGSFSTEEKLKEYHTQFKESGQINIDMFNDGVLMVDCDGSMCDTTNWKLLKMEGVIVDEESPDIYTTTQTYDHDSPCINETKDGYIEGCYEFLAPIPGIEKIEDPNNPGQFIDNPNFKVIRNSDGTVKRAAILNLRDYELGDYINKIFQIAIAVLGVLSVIMIVIAGVQYMAVESIYGKTDARNKIVGAVSGLILALGIYLILNTINPELLEVNFADKIKTVSVDIKQDQSQLNFIDATDISGVITPPTSEILNYEPLIGYMYHQQGPGGGPTILWAAKKGYAEIPSNSPFISGDASFINAHMSAQNGTVYTPAEFITRFYKILKAKEQKINTISPISNAQAVEQAASSVGVDVNVLKTICMLESYDCSRADVVNTRGYTGLFQFHPTRSWPDWRENSSSDIKSAYDNSYAGARFLKSNLNKYQSDKTKMN